MVISNGVLQKCGCLVCITALPPNSKFKAVLMFWTTWEEKGKNTVGLVVLRLSRVSLKRDCIE